MSADESSDQEVLEEWIARIVQGEESVFRRPTGVDAALRLRDVRGVLARVRALGLRASAGRAVAYVRRRRGSA